MKPNTPYHNHITVSVITHFYCDNTEKMQSIFDLVEAYSRYPKHILGRVHFVIVDDGSPVEYTPQHFGLNITWLRITDDIRWNNPGARNLGVTYAKSENILLTDADHYLPEKTLEYLCGRKECGKSFYKLRRVRDDGSIGRGHSNLFFMSRSRFLKLWGYDEHFCGDYAHDDLWFVKFHKWHGSLQRYLPKQYVAAKREVDNLRHTHSLERDQQVNESLYKEKRKLIEAHGRYHGHTRTFLDFNWDILLTNHRDPPEPKQNRLWKQLWWFRILNPFA
jgi:glycosyltransferase involved in cell wall biosynthesis